MPNICNPPNSLIPSPNLISVPLPAILVAIVTAPFWPARATISASLLFCFAFRTLCGIPRCFNILDSNSEESTAIVPTNVGCPLLKQSAISSITAEYFSRLVL